ncbi:MAG: hypothetical protein ABIL68_10995, partial [bacterium]
MKRMKKHSGRRPDKELFILTAAYFLFKKKYPERKILFGIHLPREWSLLDWINKNFSEHYIADWKNLYKWIGTRPYKEMMWEETWQNFHTAQKISDRGENEGKMSPREI